jgi:hypothetical protein
MIAFARYVEWLGYGLGVRGLIPGAKTGSEGTPSLLSVRKGCVSSFVKHQCREVGHSPLSSAKNGGALS